jgi:putative ABC transport system permease protein
MHPKHIIKTGIKSIAINKSRSAFTMLGIVIGVTSIILIISLGQGAQGLILGAVQGIGSKTIAIVPGRQPTGPADVAQMFTDSLKNKDLDLLSKKENVPGAEIIMPVVFGADTGSYGNETYHLTVFAGSETMQKILKIYPKPGVFFTADDVKEYSDGIIIGYKVKDRFFPEEDGASVLGKKIRIKGKNFRIIGITPKEGQSSIFNFDEAIVLPYTTAQRYIFGTKYFNRIIVEASSEDVITNTVVDIENTLRASHGITDPTKDDFFVETQADIVSRLGIITTALTALLVSLAGIYLVVGGIGIMNIMLVSVTERTREIGLRKAIGATNTDILFQFLFESAFLTVFGGVVGIVFGVGLSFIASVLINKFAGINWVFSFPVAGALLGISVCAFVGIVFGIYPARKAAKKSPVEAMRFE